MSLEHREPVERWPGHRGPTMRPRSRARTRLAVAVVAAAVGFLVGIQARESGGDRISRIAEERPEDLTRVLAELNSEADRLGREISSLRVKLLRYRDTTKGSAVALRDARRTLRDLEVLSGTVAVSGPGLAITIDAPRGGVAWDLMLDLVQELRDAGAEAVAIGPQRVVASTWFGPSEGGLVVDGHRTGPPYELRAIGPADGMREALEIPGGPLTIVAAEAAASVRVREDRRMTLPALQREVAFEYARPAS